MKIEGKVAFITGGCSGFGLETLKFLIERGAKVGIADLQEDLGQKIVAEFGEDRVVFTKTDVTDSEQVRQAIENTVKKFGALHITLNSAGVFLPSATVTSKGLLNFKLHKKMMDINVNGTIYSCAYSAKFMSLNEPNERGERGVIINVSSVAATYGTRGLVSYSASKGAIKGMSLPMARDLGKYGIRVFDIAPSVFLTPMTAAGSEELREANIKTVPIGRLGEPDEFAHLVIAGIENSYISGVSLDLNGGVKTPHL